MKIKNKRKEGKSLNWTDSQLHIELDDVQKTGQVTPQLLKDLDPLNFEFSFNNPAYEDF